MMNDLYFKLQVDFRVVNNFLFNVKGNRNMWSGCRPLAQNDIYG